MNPILRRRIAKARSLLAVPLVCAAGAAALGDPAPAKSVSWTVTAGQPPAIELVPPASAPMEFAAAELARYLGKILDKPVSVGPAAEGQPRIVIEKVPDASPLGDESYEISADGSALRLRGGGDLGVVFGTYEFLRRYGGCRFSGLGPDGEFVPRRSSVTAEGLPLRRKPKLWYRGLQLTQRPETELAIQWLDWLAKNGFNYVKYWLRGRPAWFEQSIRPELLKRGLKFDMGHHNLEYFWLPAKRYFAEHPEWFPLVDGKRVSTGLQLCLCTSNPEAVRTVADNVTRYLREHPEVSIVGVIPEDGLGLCHCDACTRLDVENGIDPQEQYKRAPSVPGNRATIRRYTLLVNEVARAVREEFPGVLVARSAYVDLTCPDPELPLESNVVVWVAMYGRDGCRPLAGDSPSEKNRMFFGALQAWRRAHRGRVITYSYYMGMGAQLALPYPQDRVIVREWRTIRAAGIEGATLQNWPTEHHVYGLNILAFGRSAWEDEVDPDALLDEYLEGMYGSAAGAVRPIYDAFRQAWQEAGQDAEPVSPDSRNIVRQLDRLGDARLEECLQRARENAGDDRDRRQVDRLATASEYWKAAAAVWRLERRAQEAEKAGDPAAAQSLNEQAAGQIDQALECATHLPPGWGGNWLAQAWKSRQARFRGVAPRRK